jgi:hypothetical protein
MYWFLISELCKNKKKIDSVTIEDSNKVKVDEQDVLSTIIYSKMVY